MTPVPSVKTPPNSETVPHGELVLSESSASLPVKVLYIVGLGRSGSTVLDIILGNHPDIVATGELMKWARNGIVRQDRCSCGQPVSSCEFWSRAFAEWKLRVPDLDIGSYLRRQDMFEDVPQETGPAFRLFRRKRTNTTADAFDRYALETLTVFAALRAASGKKVILDSSKHPARAQALARVSGVDLYLLHLIRDARGVAYSKAKKVARDVSRGLNVDEPGMAVWKTSLQWCSANRRAEQLRRQLPADRSMRMRYEDLVEQPEDSLTAIGRFVGCDLGQLGHALARGAEMKVHHTVAGNHLRMLGSVRLRKDDAWTTKLSRKQKIQISVLAGWMMRRYGYI